MRRGWVLAVLAVSILLTAWLVSYGTAERRVRRGGPEGGGTRSADGETVGRDAPAEAVTDSGSATARGRHVDDDPNRIPGPDVTVRGVVLRGGKPAKGALAALFRAQPRDRPVAYRSSIGKSIEIANAKCDDRGRFAITVARRTEVMVFATASGAAFAWKRLFLPREGDPPEITLELGTGYGVTGRVVDEEKKPVEGVTVTLDYSRWRATGLRMETSTDEDGVFRFDGLRAGPYHATVEPTDYPPQRRWVSVPLEGEVLFELMPGGSVIGRVTTDAGEPIAGALLTMNTGDSFMGRTGPTGTVTDSQGSYRIEHALPGPLRDIVLEHPDYGTRSTMQGDLAPPTEVVEVGEELRFDITLERGVAVNGVVVMEGSDEPVVGATVTLLRMSPKYRNLSEVATTRSGAKGRFTFAHVAEGTYGLEATAEHAMRRANRRASSSEEMTIDFFADPAHPPGEQRLELAPTGAVRGRITIDTTPYASIYLYLQAGPVFQTAYADDFGAFEFPNVPPSPEVAVRSNQPTLESDPFVVEPGETTEIELGGEEYGGFAGRVEDEDGNPIEGATVRAFLESNLKKELGQLLRSPDSRTSRTNAQGEFLVPITKSQRDTGSNAKWVLAAIHHEYQLDLSESIEMPAEGQRTDVLLELAAGGRVSGMVVTESGAPVSNVGVYAGPLAEPGQPYETRASRRTRTGLDGGFELGGLGEGIYRLSAWSPEGRAETEQVKAGDKNIRIVFSPTESIAGSVIDEDGFPIQRARVFAVLGESKFYGSVSAGRFRVGNLEAGSYEILVEPERRGSSATISFEPKREGPVQTGTEDMVITVSWGTKLKGRVIGPTGSGVGGVAVVAMTTEKPKKSRRRRRDVVRPVAITNGRGDFVLKGLGDKEVELLAWGTGFQPATLKTTPGGGAVTIHVARGETIAGRVRKPDGGPLPNQWISVYPLSKELRSKLNDWRERAGQSFNVVGGYRAFGARTDGQGRFKLTALLPGQYRLSLRSDYGVAPSDVTLQSGDLSVLVQLEPALKVSGLVVDENGRAPRIKNGRLYVGAYQGNRWLAGSHTNTDGSFEIKGLLQGEITLKIWPGRGYHMASVSVVAGSQGVRIALRKR